MRQRNFQTQLPVTGCGACVETSSKISFMYYAYSLTVLFLSVYNNRIHLLWSCIMRRSYSNSFWAQQVYRRQLAETFHGITKIASHSISWLATFPVTYISGINAKFLLEPIHLIVFVCSELSQALSLVIMAPSHVGEIIWKWYLSADTCYI